MDNETGNAINQKHTRKELSEPVTCIIIDCLPINYLDTNGANMLKRVTSEMRNRKVDIFLARCPEVMMAILEKTDFFVSFKKEHVFVDLADAVAAVEYSAYPYGKKSQE